MRADHNMTFSKLERRKMHLRDIKMGVRVELTKVTRVKMAIMEIFIERRIKTGLHVMFETQ